jgi:hypothetical protein
MPGQLVDRAPVVSAGRPVSEPPPTVAEVRLYDRLIALERLGDRHVEAG